MQREVVLSRTAQKKLDDLFNYLENNWSLNVKQKFISKLEERVQIIKTNPKAFPKSEIKRRLHKCVVTRHTTMYYTYDDKYINILTFFNTRQDPSKLDKRLE